MNDLLQMIGGLAGNDMIGQVSKQLGSDRSATASAATAALPALLEALAQNTRDPQGAEALASALDRDHDGSALDNITDLIGGGGIDGNAILGHVLGSNRGQVEQNVSKSSGLDVTSVSKMLPMLAPIVLQMLGKQKRQSGLDAGQLAGMIAGAASGLKSPGAGGLAGMLDADGDGDIKDDVMKIGGSLLGGLFK